MKSAKIKIYLKSHLSMNDINPLDSTIMGIISHGHFYTQEEFDTKMKEIFKIENGIPLASYPIFRYRDDSKRLPTSSLTSSFKNTMRNGSFDDYVLLEKNAKINNMDSSKISMYHTGESNIMHDVAAIEYYVTGDIDQIINILSNEGSIGKLVTKGYGEISYIEYDDVSGQQIGILDNKGNLVRPVPSTFKTDTPTLKVVSRVYPPYNPSICERHGFPMDVIHTPKDLFFQKYGITP